MFQQTIKNFNINFNALNERNTISSGDLLTGNISFDLTKKMKISSVTMKLTGRAKVEWSKTSGKKRNVMTAKLDYFDLKSVSVEEFTAAAGNHVYPFTCQLPQGDFPSSLRAAYGKIVYTLTVGIHRPWHMAKDFVTQLNFLSRINTNQPELQAPLSGSNNMTLCCLWCASGPITMTAGTEKKAFVPGETMKIICEFSNASFRTATPKATLQQKQIFYTHNKENKKVVYKKLESVTGRSVRAHTSDVHTEILLTIPPSAWLTIANCTLIVIEYFIEVNLTFPASHDLTVLIPIILCDTPVNANPPPPPPQPLSPPPPLVSPK